MRKQLKYEKPSGFPERTVSKFLWLPRTIANEWRWLEKATWFEKYDSYVRKDRVWKEWRALYWVNQ